MAASQRVTKTLLAGATALLLAACQTTPLPPWQRGATAPASPGVTRLPPGKPGALPVTGAGSALAGYGSAVAALFPDPEQPYFTPGLQTNRNQFTSNQEVGAYLAHLRNGQVGSVTSRTGSIGKSAGGQDIHALFVAAAGVELTATGFEKSGKPTVLLVGGQHGDAPASSEALLVAAQKLLQGEWARTLSSVNVIIVPRANPDGAQAGSHGLGNRMDLDTDHLLLNSSEARALAVLVRDYHPAVLVDSQEFPAGGAFQQKLHGWQYYDALLQHSTAPQVAEFVGKAGREWFADPVLAALEIAGLNAHWYFATSAQPDDRSLRMGGLGGNSLRNASGLKHSVALTVASRGSDLQRMHIQRRVHTQVVAIGKVLEQAAARASHLAQVNSFVVRETASQACSGRVTLTASQAQQNKSIRLVDPSSGEVKKLNLPWYSSFDSKAEKTRARPCGYLLASNETEAVERLQLLGVTILRVAEEGSLRLQHYNETGRSAATGSATAPIAVDVDFNIQNSTVPAGSYYVPMGQPLAHVAMLALEPDSPYSFFANRITTSLGNIVRVAEPPKLVFEEID